MKATAAWRVRGELASPRGNLYRADKWAKILQVRSTAIRLGKKLQDISVPTLYCPKMIPALAKPTLGLHPIDNGKNHVRPA